MKAVLHYRASPGFVAALERARPDGLVLQIVDEDDEEGLARALADSDVLLHVLKPFRAADIARAPQLKLIQKIGVGVNTIDLDAARARGIAVCNMPGSNSQAVAEMTLMLMLAALRRIAYFDPLTRQGNGWRPDNAEIDRAGEISGRTVGFVGFGAIPRRIVPVLRALDAHIVYTATKPKPDVDVPFLPLEALLAEADIVSLHCPATAQTRGLLSRTAIAGMKKGAILVNTARGELVDEAALAEALSGGHLRAAGLDVFAHEPAAAANALFALRNVVVSPHIAWLTPETLERSIVIAFENCRRLAAGSAFLHRVV